MIDLVRSLLRDNKPACFVLVVLASLFVADLAHAQGGGVFPTQQEAYIACKADETAQIGAGSSFPGPYPHVACALFVSTGYAPYAGQYRSQSLPTNATFNFWFYATTCADGSAIPGGGSAACPPIVVEPTPAECAAMAPYELNGSLPEGAIQCDIIKRCAFEAVSDPNSGNSLMDPYQGSPGVGLPCDPNELGSLQWDCPAGWTSLSGFDAGGLGQTYCLPPEGDADGDGIPNEDDDAPEQVGDTPRDTDEDGIPDNKDAMPNDPENGEGEDGEADNTSIGGGDCMTPPVSSGDGIAAQIAFQTWKTRCAVERLTNITVTGGSSAGGLSAGDSLKLTQIKTATEAGAASAAAINGKLGTDTSGDLDARGGDGMAADGEAAGVSEDREFGADGLDDEGYGFARQCPAPPSFEYNGQTITIPTEKFCEWMELGSILVLILAAFASLRIMGTA